MTESAVKFVYVRRRKTKNYYYEKAAIQIVHQMQYNIETRY